MKHTYNCYSLLFFILCNCWSNTIYSSAQAQQIAISMAQFLALQEQAFLDQFSTLAAAGINQITNAQIATIPTSLIPVITNDQIAQFTPAQIALFSVEQIQAFQPGQIAALTVPTQSNPSAQNQILALTATQLQALSPEQIMALTPSQLDFIFDNLLPNQLASLNDYQLQTLSTDQIASFNATQIAAFTPAQIGYFTPDQLGVVLQAQKSSLLSNLSVTQISGITLSQVCGLSASLVTTLFNILSSATTIQIPNRSILLAALTGNIVLSNGTTPTPITTKQPTPPHKSSSKLSETQKMNKGAKQFFSKNNQIGKEFKKIHI